MLRFKNNNEAKARMQQVIMSFKQLQLTKYVPQTDEITIRLIVNDGKDKQLLRTVKLEEPEKLASTIITEARRKIKELHSSSEGDGILGSLTVLKLNQDEDNILERTTRFLSSCKERTRAAKAKRMSWYDLEKQLTGAQLDY